MSMQSPQSAPARLSALGSVVPDRETLRRDMLETLPGVHAGHDVASAAQLDGVAHTSPGAPTPMALTHPSGLSRPQFLVAAQAASLPAFPAVCNADGGFVLDRVLASAGSASGDGWWTTLTGRVKAQRLFVRSKQGGWRAACSRPDSYALCHNAFFRLPNRLGSLRTRATFAPEGDLGLSLPPGTKPGAALRAWLTAHRQHASAAATLRRRLPGAELRADVRVQQPALAPHGGHDPTASTAALPPALVAALDLRTPNLHTSTFQYRLGVQHVVMASPGSGDDANGSSTPAAPTPGAATHLQAAVGLQGFRTLWKGRPASRRASNARRVAGTARGPSTGAAPTLPGASQAGPPRSKALGPHNPIRQFLQKLLRPGGSSEGAARGSSGAGLGSDHANHADVAARPTSLGPLPCVAQLPAPSDVQAAFVDATQSVKRLREDVQALSEWVSSGGFAQQLQAGASRVAAGGGAGGKAPTRGKPDEPAKAPWSSLVGAPHLRVAGLVGLAVRQPLWQSELNPAPGGVLPGGKAGSNVPPTPRVTASGGVGSAGGGGGGLVARANSLSADLVRSGVAWLAAACAEEPPSGATPRAFASLGASAQLGWFQRPFLDFTRATARLDLGLPGSPQDSGPRGGWVGPSGDPANTWHALSLSLSQQLVGPVRLCADVRYGLDLSKRGAGAAAGLPEPPPTPIMAVPTPSLLTHAESMRARAQQVVSRRLRGAARRVQGARATLLDTVVGLDVTVPHTAGFARIVAWYALHRQEGILELRLL